MAAYILVSGFNITVITPTAASLSWVLKSFVENYPDLAHYIVRYYSESLDKTSGSRDNEQEITDVSCNYMCEELASIANHAIVKEDIDKVMSGGYAIHKCSIRTKVLERVVADKPKLITRFQLYGVAHVGDPIEIETTLSCYLDLAEKRNVKDWHKDPDPDCGGLTSVDKSFQNLHRPEPGSDEV